MNFGRFFKNIYYLSKINLKKDHSKLKSFVNLTTLHSILDSFLYEVVPDLNKINMASFEECLYRLQNDKVSICRFGDGELNLCEEINIPFQKASPKLAKRLREVLASDVPHTLIALTEIFCSNRFNCSQGAKIFARNTGRHFIDIIEKYTKPQKTYYSAEVSLVPFVFPQYDLKKYYEAIISIWKDKDITIICGKTVFDKIEHNIFDFAKSVEYQYAPSINAFEEYDSILTQALTIDKNRLVIIILGPTATVLAYDMALQGYQALDLGHIAKSYDWYVKKDLINNLAKTIEFFSPD